ncbi:unnamed protein product [Macrosiphum euphorbiae]|uniref:Secreted protein n=1 Tax=Macrosiphum euphorbiae TaxID=13131 RepID=A0AAV0VN70_9HEMI|nr:unnamed protein product [Macrosiphum euphorbiae]
MITNNGLLTGSKAWIAVIVCFSARLTNLRSVDDEKMTNKAIEWKCNPPTAPHFRGRWGSEVRNTKFNFTHDEGNDGRTIYHIVQSRSMYKLKYINRNPLDM